MPEPHTFLLFAGASILLLVVPGPAAIYVLPGASALPAPSGACSERAGVVYLGLGMTAALAEGGTER